MLVLGTHNRKKRLEMAQLLEPLGWNLKTLADFSDAIEVEETGATFAENALLKASVQAIHLGQSVLGEDSGLVVPALDGAPGIYSARYSGENASDESNNQCLLEALKGKSPEQRTAYYVCHMTLCDAEGELQAESESRCYGRIRAEPAGTNGFGYDPLFEIIEYHQTFGQLGPSVKATISHRARASRRLAEQIALILMVGSAGRITGDYPLF